MTPTCKPFHSATEPALSILLFLDSPVFRDPFPLALLRAILEESGARVEVVDRVKEGVLTPIDAGLLAGHHELWFFLADKALARQLVEPEIEALRAWMDRGGGVLVTGDHADLNLLGDYEGLGRAIGRRIPRARHLRIWDARPGVTGGRLDTTDDDAAPGAESEELEQDAAPQRLLLPNLRGRGPHVLFLDSEGRRLDRLPDHRHEGLVVVPSLVNEIDGDVIPALANEWPAHAPVPEVIARSVAWRRGDHSDLMVAWDGHRAPFEDPGDHASHAHGRILADASWHHYVDFNLRRIASENPTDWAKLRALYINIAAWLAPRWLKQRYVARACAEIGAQPDYVLFERTDRQISEQARRLLARRLPGAWFHELLDDMLVEHKVTPASAIARDFGAVLLGAFMRRLMTDDAMPPVLRSTPQDAAPPPGSGILAQAVASYDDELQHKLAAWTALRTTMRGR